ncbi:MAG: 50S ribosomal protein L29 [Verrucomicrobiota bacterium]
MKIKEIRDQSIDELLEKRRELKQEAFNLRLQQRSGQLENPARLTIIRKDVARIETTLTGKRASAAAK